MTLPQRTKDLPDLRTLLGIFGPPEEVVARHEIVPSDQMPSPYRELLVHQEHMTVTVESHHNDKVRVRILDHWQTGDTYARKILLTLKESEKVVQFGVVCVDLAVCEPEVRDEIVAGQIPFGRVLISHDVLRRIEPISFFRAEPGPSLRQWFNIEAGVPVYGRIALIHCNGEEAVDLLEIVAPC